MKANPRARTKVSPARVVVNGQGMVMLAETEYDRLRQKADECSVTAKKSDWQFRANRRCYVAHKEVCHAEVVYRSTDEARTSRASARCQKTERDRAKDSACSDSAQGRRRWAELDR